MKILAIGDVVGETAAAWLAEQLPAVREFHAVDWIVVNAENCAVTGPSPMNGFGMTPAVLDLLDAGGVDVIKGVAVKCGTTADVFADPQHEYTHKLVAASSLESGRHEVENSHAASRCRRGGDVNRPAGERRSILPTGQQATIPYIDQQRHIMTCATRPRRRTRGRHVIRYIDQDGPYGCNRHGHRAEAAT